MLTQLRLNITDMLTAAGISAAEYVSETITPPVAVAVPGEPYLIRPAGEDSGVPFGSLEVRFDVLIIGHKGSNKKSAAKIDDLIWEVLDALNSQWDIDRVSQPGEITLSGSKFMGAVASISQNVKEP